MLKRLAVLCVLVGVSFAAAATLKMKFFTWTDGIGDKDGVATLHYVPGENGGYGAGTKIHVTITGFVPNTSYGVYTANGLVDSGTANGILTNDGGNGEVNLFDPTLDITSLGPQTVKIYVDDPNNPNIGYYDAGEEVARGTAQ